MLAARSGVIAVVLVAASAAAAFGDSSAAFAADSDIPIELSSDGVTWSPFLTGGLFDEFQGAVPGDSVTKSFYVQNPEDYPVTMKTRALDVVSSSTGLSESLTVQGTAGSVSLAAPVTLSALADCSTLAPDITLAALAVTKVSITVTLPEATNGTLAQASRGGFDVLLTMQDNAAGTPPVSCDSTGGGAGGTGGDGGGGNGGGTGGGGGGGGNSHGSHPTTGTPAVTTTGGWTNPLAFTGADGSAALFLGGALLALGFLLLVARRRRRKEQQES